MLRARLIAAAGPAALALVGAAFALVAWGGIDLGTLRRLGPGAFPLGLGIGLFALALIVLAEALRRPFPVDRPDLRGVAAVAAAIAAFAALTERAGLVPAVFVSVLAMTTVLGLLRWPGRLVLAAGVTAGVWAVFIAALQLPMRAVVGL
jgi:putative tricarboxylic transport membrane protein